MSDSEEKAFNAPPVTKYLVAMLILVHILLLVTDTETLNWVYQTLAFSIDNTALLLQTGEGSFGKFFFTLTSHMFLHHDFMHLLLNAFMLLAFGAMVERYYGLHAFIIVFLASGWLGAMGEYFVSSDTGGFLYGASGAVFGMMGATMLLMLPRFGLQKIIGFAAVMMGLNLVIGLTPLGTLLTGGDASISWAAHLVGFIIGACLSVLFKPTVRD
ncbi:rhomboid family intramembrane serine protease [Sneathiella glossodoripedis]|uniref:rhomboid family intramembrane serine protease n=1 Tax=Sneathiella glossodoripedis TaxID=418853 RepID=UPI00131F3AB5|nr:rhomboid family intramembrane serine protease [Sneathiella glossodoripedis]